jgi:nucleotide-binding universal stress UspA family protein
MFDSILVPLDGSLLAEGVLPHAIALARAFGARLTLVRVLDKNQACESPQLFDLLNWQIYKTEAKLYLEKVSSRLRKTGLQIEETVLEGLVAETISEYSQSHSMKLIILSSHGHTGLSQWGISSVTQKIIFSAPTSVLIVRAHQPTHDEEMKEQPYGQILAPLDGSWRAENVLPAITLLAHAHKSQIHIAHVVRTPEMARHMPLEREDVELSNRVVSRNREEAIRYLDQMRQHSPLAGIDIKTHLLTSDNPAAALHDLAANERIDMVALSAHGYSGNNQWPYGSMVNNFILYGKVPLLIVQDLPPREEPLHMDAPARAHTEHP